MTTKQEETRTELLVPEVLTDEHHEAIRASWELPPYEREQTPQSSARRPLVAGLVAGAIGLAIGFGAGYLVRGESVQVAEPIVVTAVPSPVDANGAPFGQRLAPLETQAATDLPVAVLTDANGAPFGQRLAPLETQVPSDLPVPVLTDANGAPFGQRLPAAL